MALGNRDQGLVHRTVRNITMFDPVPISLLQMLLELVWGVVLVLLTSWAASIS